MVLEVYKVSGSQYPENATVVNGSLYVEFAGRFFELVQDAFARVYRNVSEKFWNNGVYASVRQAYYTCNFNVGFGEYYIPTVLDSEGFMHFHRVVVVVLPELESEIYEAEIKRVLVPSCRPMGVIDSTTIFIVAPRGTRRHRLRVFLEKFKAMLKIKRPSPTMRDTLVIPIIHPEPEIAFKKLMTHVSHFWNVRVKRFVEALKLQPYQYDYKLENLLSITLKVIENYSSQIIHCLRSMVAHLLWFTGRLKEALKRIGALNILKAKVFAGLREIRGVELPREYAVQLQVLVADVLKHVG
ncbi:MAG: hypothetical protein QXR84_08840 [Candidatus Bathyarchaeia archaeon]